MMQAEPTIPDEPCPICGANPACRIWSETAGYGFVSILSTTHAFTESRAKPLVCTACGYVQLFVNPDDFHKSKDGSSSRVS
jgi:hypothetical protein